MSSLLALKIKCVLLRVYARKPPMYFNTGYFRRAKQTDGNTRLPGVSGENPSKSSWIEHPFSVVKQEKFKDQIIHGRKSLNWQSDRPSSGAGVGYEWTVCHAELHAGIWKSFIPSCCPHTTKIEELGIDANGFQSTTWIWVLKTYILQQIKEKFILNISIITVCIDFDDKENIVDLIWATKLGDRVGKSTFPVSYRHFIYLIVWNSQLIDVY